jgi:TolA-binding protein
LRVAKVDASALTACSRRQLQLADPPQLLTVALLAESKANVFRRLFANRTYPTSCHYGLGESIATFETVLQRWPNIAEADKTLYNLAMARFQVASNPKQLDGLLRASKDFEAVRTRFPHSELAGEAVYFQGECLFNADDLAGASTAYQTLITHYPSSTYASRAYYDLGVVQQTLNDNAAALKTYQSFLSKPEHATHELALEIKVRLAACLQATGELDRAAEQLASVAQTLDAELAPYATLQLGQIKHEQAKYAETASLLRDFATKFPKSDYRNEATKLAGHSYYLADQPQQAIDLLAALANSDGVHSAEAAYWLGRSQLKLKQPEQALQTFEKAVSRFVASPFLPFLKFARVDAIATIAARQPEAAALYETFLNEHPTHSLAPQAAYLAALTSFNTHKYAKARELAEAYLSKPDGDAAIAGDLRYIAAESWLLEKPDDANARTKAESHYRELISKHPEHGKVSQARLRIGWCLQSAEKYADAIQWLRSELSKLDTNQQLPEAQLLIGTSHRALGQHREALTAFNASMATNAAWERGDEAISGAADSHRALGETDQANGMYRKLVDTHRKSLLRPQSLYSLGEIAKQQSKLDEAIQWFQQITTEHADSELVSPAMHALATLYFAKQQYPQTREWATRVIDGKPTDELKQRARYVRGLAWHSEGQFASAIDDLAQYRQAAADPNEAIHADYIACLCRVSLKQFDQAQNQINELIKVKTRLCSGGSRLLRIGPRPPNG